MNVHFLPQHLHCGISCGVRLSYLRVAEASVWFPRLVAQLGHLVSEGWGWYNGHPCFIRVDGPRRA